MENQHRVNRRRRRNLPAELKVEIVDCLPLENAAHFLASVPSRLIIHHCAPRLRRMLKLIDQIVISYTRTMPTPDSDGDIRLHNGHKYTPEMDIFLRYGAAHCEYFAFCSDINDNDGFVGHPVDFFNDLIKHYYETKVPTKAVTHLDFELPLTNPAPWPAALVQPQAGEMKVEELKVYYAGKWIEYALRNKHNPGIEFMLWIYFEGDAKCHEQMTRIVMHMIGCQL